MREKSEYAHFKGLKLLDLHRRVRVLVEHATLCWTQGDVPANPARGIRALFGALKACVAKRFFLLTMPQGGYPLFCVNGFSFRPLTFALQTR